MYSDSTERAKNDCDNRANANIKVGYSVKRGTEVIRMEVFSGKVAKGPRCWYNPISSQHQYRYGEGQNLLVSPGKFGKRVSYRALISLVGKQG